MRYCKECNKIITTGSKSGFCKSCCRMGPRSLNYDKNFSQEWRDRLSASRQGKKNHNYGKDFSIETRIKMGAAKRGENNYFYGKTLSKDHRDKISLSNKGKIFTKIHLENLSNSHKGIKHHNYGKNLSRATVKKMRISAINRVSKSKFNGNQIIPNYNPEACKVIDEYGENNGYNFQHAENGGEYHIKELGYWVDGYDKKKNVVVEYYENKHGNSVYKDFNREIEISNFLACDFIILWEKQRN